MEDFGVEIDLSEFFSIVDSEKKRKETEFKSVIGDIDLDTVFEQVSTLKKTDKIKNKKEKKILENIETLLSSDSTNTEISEENLVEENTFITEELAEELPIKKEQNLIERSLGLLAEPSNTKVQQDPLTPLDQKFATFEDLQKHYNIFLSRIQQQLSTLGGGGETNLTYMDVPITSVTSSSYTIKLQDYYIGVNYAGAVTITLPKADREGKVFVVKDELGEAAKGTNRHITILPTGADLIDGRNRAILAFNYGSLTFIWKGNSWRVI